MNFYGKAILREPRSVKSNFLSVIPGDTGDNDASGGLYLAKNGVQTFAEARAATGDEGGSISITIRSGIDLTIENPWKDDFSSYEELSFTHIDDSPCHHSAGADASIEVPFTGVAAVQTEDGILPVSYSTAAVWMDLWTEAVDGDQFWVLEAFQFVPKIKCDQ